ncbi:MAG: hypothetical protein ACF8MF_06580 [Phycisphaerales bacterium JB052]
MNRQPWERLEDESEKAFLAFECYMDLPRGERTVRKAYVSYQKRLKGKDEPATVGIPGYFGEWSANHDWLNRAVEFDSWKAKQIHKQAAIKVAEARLEYLDHLPELVRAHLECALGLEDEVTAVQWKALKDALDRAGVVIPDRIELTGADGGAIKSETSGKVEHGILDAEKALKVAAVLGSMGVLNVDQSNAAGDE